MAKNNNLSDLLKDIANSIKVWEGNENINPQEFSSKIVNKNNNGWGAFIIRSKKNNIIFGDNSDIICLGLQPDIVSIKEGSFDDYTGLKNLYIYCDRTSEDNTINIGSISSLFSNCPLEKVRLEKNLINNNDEVFQSWGSAQVINTGSESFTNLSDYLTNIADVIRERTNTTDLINPQDFSEKISGITNDDSGFYVINRNNSLMTFGDNSDITELTLTDKISAIKEGGFIDYTGLKKLTIDYNNSSINLGYGSSSDKSPFENCPIEYLTIERPITLGGSYQELIPKHTLRELTISDTIPPKLFCDQSQLTTISLKGVIGEIGSEAFSGCGKHPSYDFDVTLKLENIGIFQIGDRAFYNSNISGELNLSDYISKIGESAFENNDKITWVYFTGNGEYFSELKDRAFANCRSLERFDFPRKISGETFWKYTGGGLDGSGEVVDPTLSPFYNCKALKIIVFPEDIKLIPDFLLSNTSTVGSLIYLKYAKMPKEVTSIGKWAFDGRNVTEFDFSESTVIPKLNHYSFSQVYSSIIIVPDNLYNAWCAADYWTYFANNGNIKKASEYTWNHKPDNPYGELTTTTTTTSTTTTSTTTSTTSPPWR